MLENGEMEELKIGDYVAYKYIPEGLLYLGYFHDFLEESDVIKYKCIAIGDDGVPMLVRVND